MTASRTKPQCSDSRPGATANLDRATVDGFGAEWSTFDYSGHDDQELREIFEQYFSEFPWKDLPEGAEGFDLGCGTGRWARLAAPRVGTLHCVDASEAALEVARKNLHSLSNCQVHHASVDALPFADSSMDFGYSLGVLHHVPETLTGIRACVEKLKPGAPFLVYLYYALDNRPLPFRALWRASNVVRETVSRLPFPLRSAVSEVIAASVYWPLARSAGLLDKAGFDVDGIPLAAYRHRSFYVMRTDALDRFGTRLEQRFTREQIRTMMEAAGLTNISFRDAAPYWCAVGRRST